MASPWTSRDRLHDLGIGLHLLHREVPAFDLLDPPRARARLLEGQVEAGEHLAPASGLRDPDVPDPPRVHDRVGVARRARGRPRAPRSRGRRPGRRGSPGRPSPVFGSFSKPTCATMTTRSHFCSSRSSATQRRATATGIGEPQAEEQIGREPVDGLARDEAEDPDPHAVDALDHERREGRLAARAEGVGRQHRELRLPLRRRQAQAPEIEVVVAERPSRRSRRGSSPRRSGPSRRDRRRRRGPARASPGSCRPSRAGARRDPRRAPAGRPSRPARDRRRGPCPRARRPGRRVHGGRTCGGS